MSRTWQKTLPCLSVEAGTGWTACLAVVQALRQEFISALVVCRVVSGEIYDFEVNEHIKIRHTGEILNMFRQTYSFPY
ncbi:hypothetical protein ACQUW2_03985, partial [Enterobacter hormaechei]